MSHRVKIVLVAAVCTGLAVLAFQAGALVQPDDTGVAEKTYRVPGFEIRHQLQQADRLPEQARGPALRDLESLGVPAERGLVDPRSGRWSTLVMVQPMIPGNGKGNGLGWQQLGLSGPPANENAFGSAAWNAFSEYVQARRGALRVDPAQFSTGRKVTVQRAGDLVQIFAPREVDGVPVRDSYVTATVSHGNMVLFGAHQWDDVKVSTIPSVAREAAMKRVEQHLAPFVVDGTWGKSQLVIQPLADDTPGKDKGYQHRLAWVVRPYVEGSLGSWEGLVDAHTGELLSFEDTNHYATTREVVGGVLPISNDGQSPDGVEQAGWPMPYADLTLAGSGGGATCGNGICEAGDGEDCVNCAADCNGVQSGNPNNRFCCGGGGGTNPVDCSDSRCTSGGFDCTNDPVGGGGGGGSFFTDGNGNLLACTDGEITTTLSGRFMHMNDACGSISESTTGALLDLGTNTGTDCSVPSGASAGNTRSSRSGFYEMNRIKEMARGQLPDNPWLQDQLTANMNLNADCNAFWNGSTVNFYTSGGGCANTGELAGVFDHEWAHGMDNNDANPSISSPGEGIADIYAALRMNQSCIGRGFLLGSNCGGYGDPCIDCDGVRDIDFAQRSSGLPHDVAWADANCGSGGSTPCGGSTHCEGYVYSESVWDLEHRDLPTAGLDSNLAKEIATRLTYLGAGNVGQWFTCVTDGEAGCGASGGYLNYLAADDDNGDISDGTPHMSAIFAAFDRHGIACSTPTVTDSGCAGTPTTAPTVSANGIDRAVQLSWGAVSGTSVYRVYRTDGVFGCDFGKALVGETTGTSFTDEGLLNGHEYYYTVIPVGAADTCMGPASACTTGTPVAGANAAIDQTSVVVSLSGGDGDAFLDNCEVATVSFDVGNVGNGGLTNVRVSDVRTPSHPTLTVLTTLPAATSPSSLAACDIGVGSFDFVAENGELLFNDTVVIEVDVTSDELSALGLVKTATLTVDFAESDFQSFASKTYTYEADIEGWSEVQGTFQRDNADGGGAQGSTWYVESSEFLANQCDQLQSPVLRLSSGSTLSAYTRFDIEEQCTFPNCSPAQWFDRANIGLVDAAGNRSPIDPDGGRLYNASGINGTCGTDGQNGWADTADSWAESTWSSSALETSSFAGEPVRLDVRYGTDVALEGFGFRIDHVTLTDFEEQGPDAQTDTCDELPVCGDGTCNGNETQCSCPEDCGTPPSSEVGLCADGIDNDCDLFVDCDDSDCDGDPNCPTGPICGNGTCESGEDCNSCSADCDSITNGPPSGRHCCGNGVLEGPEGDGRCDGNV